MRGRKIPYALPYTGTFSRRRHTLYIRIAVVLFLVLFVFLQINILNDNNDLTTIDVTNDSTAAILSMVPPVFHKYLRSKSRNGTHSNNGTRYGIAGNDLSRPSNISEIKHMIARYNEAQMVLNEDLYGPLLNDSVIIVVQVHKRIKYLRHLIVSLAQAKDISKTLLIFSHDYYDEEINDLVQTIDFCKVLQIFYPYSIQTHPNEFPGADPNDCPRDMKKEEALKTHCNNALYPDLYGHYREPAFTQTKHHWFWKTNTVFDGLDVTRHHSGMVVFLEEDHYVAEDFLNVLSLMQTKAREACAKCNILSLGTYLKTFNYYTYSNKKPPTSHSKTALFGHRHSHSSSASSSPSSSSSSSSSHTVAGVASHGYHASSSSSSSLNTNKNKINSYPAHSPSNNIKNNNQNTYNIFDHHKSNGYHGKLIIAATTNMIDNKNNYEKNYNNEIIENHENQQSSSTLEHSLDDQLFRKIKQTSQPQWSFQVLPSLYSVYQKAELTPWISSKHNMGMTFNRTTWREIKNCAMHFCSYDDYNWDWSLQHLSQQCLQQKLYAMVVKGPRVFHIGECGVHHKKNNCESNQVISKVQQVIHIATKAGQLFPKSITLTMPSVIKKTKLRKGNGGWGDRRDHQLCLNMTHTSRF